MIECVFTIDYEIYGNGEGSMRDLIYEPAQRLMSVFRNWDARFVPFVEVAELEMVEAMGTDPAIDLVKQQIREFHRDGFELGLHMHPQWYNARYENGRWLLDYREYNLCVLPPEQIRRFIDRALTYFRKVLGEPGFVPISFRAGNWLFQPSQDAAAVLIENGIHLDSSVFKGGLQRNHGLDYRPALKNGYFWRFQHDANLPEPEGKMLEIPTYAVMVPFWKMLTAKRVGLQRRSQSTAQTRSERWNRLRDYLRPWYPLKFDFCRMTLEEMTHMMRKALADDQRTPETYKPLVAIGHTKDLEDLESIDRFLAFLRERGIPVATFDSVRRKCLAVASGEAQFNPSRVPSRQST